MCIYIYINGKSSLFRNFVAGCSQSTYCLEFFIGYWDQLSYHLILKENLTLEREVEQRGSIILIIFNNQYIKDKIPNKHNSRINSILCPCIKLFCFNQYFRLRVTIFFFLGKKEPQQEQNLKRLDKSKSNTMILNSYRSNRNKRKSIITYAKLTVSLNPLRINSTKP